MSFIGGYQSDVKLEDLTFKGDLPVVNNTGGFGVATGNGNYEVSLDPPITELKEGVTLQIQFAETNETDSVSLQVNDNEQVPLVRVQAIDTIEGENKSDSSNGEDGIGNGDDSDEVIEENGVSAFEGLSIDKSDEPEIPDKPIHDSAFDSEPFGLAEENGLEESTKESEEQPSIIEGFDTVFEIAAGEIDPNKIYFLIYKDEMFQIVNDSKLTTASESSRGIASVADQSEVLEGTLDSKMVTPKKLALYFGQNSIGFWKDRGFLHPSFDNNFPAAKKGDAFTIQSDGVIGADDDDPGLRVQEGDIFYCKNDTPGGKANAVARHWNIIQADIPEASEVELGISKIASSEEVTAGENDTKFVTPKKLQDKLDETVQDATEETTGITSIANEEEVRSGEDDFKYVTPKKLKVHLDEQIVPATEETQGITSLANTAEVTAGENDEKIVTPKKLQAKLDETVKDATQAQKGIAAIASQDQVNTGTDDNKFVTPLKLASYVADKVTGLWKDKGTIDASTFPQFPAGIKGDAYTISAPGYLGDSDGGEGVQVQARDVIYCVNDNNGGFAVEVADDWNVIQSNLEQATELVAGFARIASEEDIDDGENDSSIVTPAKLEYRLESLEFDSPPATETIQGIAELANQAETNAGADDTKIVTPKKLKTLIDLIVKAATTSIRGIAEIATQTEVNAGTDNSRIVTPLTLSAALQNLVSQATESIAGIAEIATQAEVDTGSDNTRVVTPLRLKIRLDNLVNRHQILTIQADQINPAIFHTPGRNRYSAVNGNLIVTRDIRLKPNGAIPATIGGHLLNFPKPDAAISIFSFTVITNYDNVFFVSIDGNGRVTISGTFTNANEELTLNINPYVALYPLQYHNVQPGS